MALLGNEMEINNDIRYRFIFESKHWNSEEKHILDISIILKPTFRGPMSAA